MIRVFDLAVFTDKANDLLNDPNYRLNQLKIYCSEETGYTTATMRLTPCAKRNLKFKRFLKRFVCESFGHPEIDELLRDKNVRLIKQHIFPTAEGTVIVLDYQVRKGRQVG
jgi:hypothetical protein